MTRVAWIFGVILVCFHLGAAEHSFDFSTNKVGVIPPGFVSFVAGKGAPGQWTTVLSEVPSQFQPLLKDAPATNTLPVLTQTALDPANERFPVLFYKGDRYGDFSLTTRLRLVSGRTEQMAGLVFRLQDEKNFYVVRLSGRGNVRFYKFVNGERTDPIGNDVPIRMGQWYELTVKATANRIEVFLDGRSVIPTLTDNSFTVGKIGFMTKSDALSEFMNATVSYQPLVTIAEKLVQDTLEKQKRLLNLRLYGKTAGRQELHVIASKKPEELGQAATEVETNVFTSNEPYLGKVGNDFVVTAPLRDRNGEVVAVAKFFLKPFAGQTEANVIARVLPTVRWMESRIASAETLVD